MKVLKTRISSLLTGLQTQDGRALSLIYTAEEVVKL
jgi:hypothetical protein